MTYTTNMMDKLEQIKAANSGEDAVVDDVAAQAYMEQFALETFQRADNAVRANKATAQTADTFQAAATFFDILKIWNPPEAEIAAKAKFARFHALRILKALKAGEDPNLSNPKQEEAPQPEEAVPTLDPNDPEVQAINGTRQPTVEDVQDTDMTQPSPLSMNGAPGEATDTGPSIPSVPATAPGVQHGDVSPLSPVVPGGDAGNDSTGGGYFPAVPTFTGASAEPSLPTAPLEGAMDTDPPADPQDFYQTQPQVPQPPSEPLQPPRLHKPSAPVVPQVSNILPAQPNPAPIREEAPAAVPVGQYKTDDASMRDATKHAKWAVSALNFEDVETAVKELHIALKSLGAR